MYAARGVATYTRRRAGVELGLTVRHVASIRDHRFGP